MKVQVFQDASGEWRWRMRSANGKVVSVSGESFKRKGWCVRSAEKFGALVGSAGPIPVEVPADEG